MIVSTAAPMADTVRAGDLHELVAELRASTDVREPWLGKREVAAFFSCSVRWIEERVREGLPHCVLAGALKFRVSGVERWLERHGHLERRGVDVGDTVVVGSENGAASDSTGPAPGHEE